jgi:hypothetical protein
MTMEPTREACIRDRKSSGKNPTRDEKRDALVCPSKLKCNLVGFAQAFFRACTVPAADAVHVHHLTGFENRLPVGPNPSNFVDAGSLPKHLKALKSCALKIEIRKAVQRDLGCPAPRAKNIDLPFFRTQCYRSRHPASMRGAYRSRHERGVGCGGCNAPSSMRALISGKARATHVARTR